MKSIKSYIKIISEKYLWIYIDTHGSWDLDVDTHDDYPWAITDYGT